MDSNIAKTANVDSRALIGNGTKIWAHSHIRESVVIGDNCIIGESVYIGPGVEIGNSVKIQNMSQIYEPSRIGDGVFIGPGVILTNDKNPRAISQSGELKRAENWVKAAVVINNGASIGAGSICIAPVEIGSWAMIAAGSVVTKDVPDFALMAGVPAKQIGWVNKEGIRVSTSPVKSS